MNLSLQREGTAAAAAAAGQEVKAVQRNKTHIYIRYLFLGPCGVHARLCTAYSCEQYIYALDMKTWIQYLYPTLNVKDYI